MPSRSLFIRTLIAFGIVALFVGNVAAASEIERDRDATPLRVAPAETVMPSTTVSVSGSATVNFAELARLDARQRAFRQTPIERVLVPSELNEDMAEPYTGPPAFEPLNAILPRLNVASPSPTNNFIGLDDIAMVDSGYVIIPPDLGGAVGPNRVMDTFNNNYRIQDKTTGATVLTVGTATFWNPVVTNKALLNQLTDPRTTYDPIQNKWIVCMQTTNNPGMILFGVSVTSDPAGSWRLYAVTPGFTSSPVLDFPVLGFNKNWIAITINGYNAGGTFQRGGCLIANYPQALAGTLSSTTSVTQASGARFCAAPCVTISATEDTLFLVTHLSSASATFVVDRITGTATPTYTTGTTTTRTGGAWVQPSGQILPQSAPVSGAASCSPPCLIETADAQVRSAPTYRIDSTTGRGFIYYTQTVGLPSTGLTHTGVQWTKLTASTTAPVLAAGGRIEDATATATNGGKWYSHPHIAVNSIGDFLIGYSQFSSAQHPSAGYSFHDYTDAISTMRDPLVYKVGDDYYHKDFGSGRNRWGDFSTAQVDPSDDKTLWVLQEYAKTRTSTDDGTTGANGSKWGSWWASVQSGFTITASAGTGGTISPSGSVTVASGGSQTFTIAANSCFAIASVTVDGVNQGAISSYTFTNVTAAHTIVAAFSASGPYAITASAGANGTVTPSGVTNVNCGASQAYTITPASCYSVAGVLVDGVSQGAITSYTFTNVQTTHTISATFAIKTYTLSASAGANGSISPSGTSVVNCGTNQAYAITPSSCYHVLDVLVDGASVGAVTSYTFSNVSANHTIAASFAINTYTITASAGANGTIAPNGVTTLNCGAGQTYAITANSGYYLSSLVVDGSSVSPVYSYAFTNVGANHTIAASFSVDVSTIAASSTASVLCPTNSSVTIPVTLSRNGPTPVLGYSVQFQLSPGLTLTAGTSSVAEGSFLSGSGSTLFNVIDKGSGLYQVDDALLSGCGPSGSGTLFTVTLSSSIPTGPGTVSMATLKLRDCLNGTLTTAAGPAATVPIDNGAPVVTVTSPNGGETWIFGSSQAITWTATDNFGVANVDIAYSTDGGATYPNAIATGVANSGSYAWAVPNSATSQARIRVTAHDINCSSGADASDANFTISPPTVTITASAGSGGSISPSGAVSVPVGGSQSFAISAAACYSIADVLVDGSSVGAVASYTFSNVTANHTIAASFSLNTYTITASAGAGGSISPSGAVSVNCGANQSFAISANSCYSIADVLVDGSSVGAVASYTFTNVTAAHTIAASFSLNTYTITASAGAGGSISPNGAVSVNCGANQSFSIAANSCYSIADVLVDGSSVGAVASYTFTNVTANHTIAASFSLNTYTITASAGAGGSISPNGAVSVNCGANQSFAISAAACYSIADVLVDGNSVGAVASYTFSNVTANHTIAASFSLNTYTITASAGAGGSISPSGAVSVNCGANQSFAITAAACNSIADVLVDGNSVGAVSSYTFSNVTANHTIAASFSLNTYTITASAGAGGSISPSGVVSVNCGASQSFTIAAATCFHIQNVLVDGNSVGAVGSYAFSNVTANHTIVASFAPNASSVTPVTALNAAQVKLGNDADGTTKVTITYTAPGGAASVEVWRKGYGSYPTYGNGGGSVPPSPGAYPPAGWTLTGVNASGQTDEPATRDFWYYVAYAKDACGNASSVSNETGGALNYHLGDVSDGITAGQGDNKVSTPDISLLGSHYGASGGALAGYEYLDVGPTTTNTTNGRPTVDSKADFEDLVMFALNYTPHVSLATKAPVSGASVNVMSVRAAATVTAGELIEVPVELNGAGDLQAVSVALKWNPAVVEPIDAATGELVSSQAGVMFSPAAGHVDAAILGAGRGLTGQGVLATIKFRALTGGNPGILIDHAIGRDASNHPVSISVQAPTAVEAVVTATDLQPVIPNPMRKSSVLQYSLAKAGPVELAIYSVDGRKVRTLAHGIQEVGRYRLTWDGADDRGEVMKSGVFFARLETAGLQKTRLIALVR